MIRYLNLESHLPLIIALGMFGAHKTMQHVTETERGTEEGKAACVHGWCHWSLQQGVVGINPLLKKNKSSQSSNF